MCRGASSTISALHNSRRELAVENLLRRFSIKVVNVSTHGLSLIVL